jgi:hypothetical protein
MSGDDDRVADQDAALLIAADIFRPRPVPCWSAASDDDVVFVRAALPALGADDVGADLVELLASVVAARDDQIRTIRAVLSAALALAHEQHCEIARLGATLARLRDEYQALRVRTLWKAEGGRPMSGRGLTCM